MDIIVSFKWFNLEIISKSNDNSLLYINASKYDL